MSKRKKKTAGPGVLRLLPGEQPTPVAVPPSLDQQLIAWLEANNARLHGRVMFDSDGRPPQFVISVVPR